VITLKKLSLLFVLFFVLFGCSNGNNEQDSNSEVDNQEQGVGLMVSGEKDIKSLMESSDLIVSTKVDENYETKRIIEDKEYNTYLIQRIDNATVTRNFKDTTGNAYKKKDKIKFVIPLGFQQIKEGKPTSDVKLLYDKTISFDSRDYLLFLVDIKGEYHFTNGNHIYKEDNKPNSYTNIATDSIPSINIEDIQSK
jgi:predicted DNA binding CopG/RHH family protein